MLSAKQNYGRSTHRDLRWQLGLPTALGTMLSLPERLASRDVGQVLMLWHGAGLSPSLVVFRSPRRRAEVGTERGLSPEVLL